MVDFAPTPVSAAEFLQLPETMQIIQLLEGEIIVSPSPRSKHQFAEVWVLNEKEFDRVGLFGTGERFISPVLGDKAVEFSEIFSV